MKKNVKIFAAFDKDVEEDIVRFGDFLRGLNVQCSNLEFTIFKSEKELCESLERPKEQIDGELEVCECFLLVSGGEYTLDKLNRAIEQYAKTRVNPDIHIFVNAANKGAEKIINFFASEKYGHYVEQFRHIDTFKVKFLIWLRAKHKDFTYETDTDIHGTPVIKVGGNPVSSLVDFDALLNNEDYQDDKKKLIRKRAQCEKYREEALRAEGKERDDLWDEISALAKEIERLQDRIAAMERDTLSLYQNYARMTLESGYNAKLKLARECIEQGELDRARKVLDPDGSINNLRAMADENEVLAARMETNKKTAEQEINVLFAEIDRLKLDAGNINRFEEIEKSYANIEYFQEKLGMEITVLYAYAEFLAEQNKYNAAIEKYTKELTRCRILAQTNPDAYLPDLAKTLDKTAVMRYYTNSYAEAEANYAEALKIKRKLAEANPDAYLPDVALTLNNLANLQIETNRYAQAEANYAEALAITLKLTETNPDAYLPKLAMVLDNIANLQIETNRYAEAESNYTESLAIKRRLAQTGEDAYLSDVAMTLNNLAVLQINTGRYAQAEANYTESLAIRRKLAESNPNAYLPNVATTLNNLANLQKDTNRYEEAESNITESLSIRRKLAESNPDMYLPNVAVTLNSLASLQINTNRYEEAEANITEALEIRRKFAQTNPDAHLPNLAIMLNNLASLQAYMNRYTQAESNYTEALEILTDFFDKTPEKYRDDLINVIEGLIEVKEELSKDEEAAELGKRLDELYM